MRGGHGIKRKGIGEPIGFDIEADRIQRLISAIDKCDLLLDRYRVIAVIYDSLDLVAHRWQSIGGRASSIFERRSWLRDGNWRGGKIPF